MEKRICEPAIDVLTRKEIAWRVSYCGEDFGHAINALFAHWWGKRRLTLAWNLIGKHRARQIFDSEVAAVLGELDMRKRGRCPGCGCKLKATRCLACDLRKYLESEDDNARIGEV
jgi:hypothetical protein